jgi:hypothetical protein
LRSWSGGLTVGAGRWTLDGAAVGDLDRGRLAVVLGHWVTLLLAS